MDPITLLALIPGMPRGANSLSALVADSYDWGSIVIGLIFGLILVVWFSVGLERWYTYMTGRDRKGRRVGRHRNGE